MGLEEKNKSINLSHVFSEDFKAVYSFPKEQKIHTHTYTHNPPQPIIQSSGEKQSKAIKRMLAFWKSQSSTVKLSVDLSPSDPNLLF